MSILGTDAYRFALGSALSSARESVSLASAFISIPGIEWVLEHLSPSISSLKVLARWNCADLVSGASDLEVYTILRDRGARFYVLLDLHAKITLVDDLALLLGSANITNYGLRLVPGGNREIGVCLIPTTEDIRVIDTLFDEAVEVNPDLYEDFRLHVERLKKLTPVQTRPEWPTELTVKLVKSPERLWVTELLWCDSPNKLITFRSHNLTIEHDLTLLGIEIGMTKQFSEIEVREKFLKSRAWQWLISRLIEADAHELYFGQLTALLHEALLDDPKPYRRDVKTLVVNLVTWTSEVGQSLVSIDQPKHSQRLRLIR